MTVSSVGPQLMKGPQQSWNIRFSAATGGKPDMARTPTRRRR
jgi:hypothetical protein